MDGGTPTVVLMNGIAMMCYVSVEDMEMLHGICMAILLPFVCPSAINTFSHVCRVAYMYTHNIIIEVMKYIYELSFVYHVYKFVVTFYPTFFGRICGIDQHSRSSVRFPPRSSVVRIDVACLSTTPVSIHSSIFSL